MCGHDMLPFKHLSIMQLSLMGSPDMQVPQEPGELRDSYLDSPRSSLPALFDTHISITRQPFQVTVDEVPNAEELRLQNCALLTHMWHFRARRCEDPRDRVYALLNLSRDVNKSIMPNYDEPVDKTYTRTARAIMTKHRNLDILFLCHEPAGTNASEGERPSWVPNLDFNPDHKSHFWMRLTLTV